MFMPTSLSIVPVSSCDVSGDIRWWWCICVQETPTIITSVCINFSNFESNLMLILMLYVVMAWEGGRAIYRDHAH